MNRVLGHLFVAGLAAVVGCHGAATIGIPMATTAAVERLSPAISAADLRADVTFLASDECGGRLTGSPGVMRAGQYIVASYTKSGLDSVMSDGRFDQPFEFAAGVTQTPGRNRLEVLASADVTASEPCVLDRDFRPLTFSASDSVEGDVVFVGYGLVEPRSADGTGYDSYAGVDVAGKIVLVLRDVPEDVPAQRRQQLSRYSGSRYKAKLASDRGAKGFLLVTGPNSPNGGALAGFRTSDRTSSVPIASMSISGALADRWVSTTGVDLKSMQSALDGGALDPHAGAMVLGRIRMAVGLDRVRKTCRNLIGALPPRGGSDEYVLVGAHYDHIGTGEGLGSLARGDEKGGIHNGADDNASGTATVLELAAALAEARRGMDPSVPQRGILFACWSGEELGLVGSSYFVKHPPVPLDKIVASFNFDMVGRLNDNKLIVQSVGSSPVWRGLLERRNVPAGFNLALNDDPFLPTDSTVLYTSGVPGLSFFTDLHDDYNRPTDDADTLNYEGMERVANLARRLVEDAARPDREIAYAKIERAAPAAGGGGRRAYTGIVPDYASGDVEGTAVADVRAGGPADKAGIRGGDYIVEFAGQKIRNLQDYADALVGAKVGEAVPVVVMRSGERVTLTITPGGGQQ